MKGEGFSKVGRGWATGRSLVHYPFNKGIGYWLERHNRYSSMEAKKLLNERLEKVEWSNFLSKDPMLKRKAFKAFAYRMPFRPLLTFCFLYFFKLGFLDGKARFHFSVMSSIYEYMISLKMRKLRSGIWRRRSLVRNCLVIAQRLRFS